MEARVLQCGDAGVLVEVGAGAPLAAAWRVLALDGALRGSPPPGVIEAVPGLRSLLVEVAPGTDLAATTAAVLALAAGLPEDVEPTGAGRRWRLPVALGGEHGPDLDAVAAAAGATADAVVAMLLERDLTVAAIGHLPGLPYLVGLPERLSLPRRQRPRPRVPAGAVAIAAGMACVYPVAAPGGWHLVGRTPALLVDPAREPPVLLAPGDGVRLVAVDAAAAAASDHGGGRWGLAPA